MASGGTRQKITLSLSQMQGPYNFLYRISCMTMSLIADLIALLICLRNTLITDSFP